MADRPDTPWTAKEVAEQYAKASPTIKRVQQVLAENADQELSAEHLATLIGVHRRSLAGAMGADSAWIYRRYRRYNWPFSVRRDTSVSQTYYAMPEMVASVIRRRTPIPPGDENPDIKGGITPTGGGTANPLITSGDQLVLDAAALTTEGGSVRFVNDLTAQSLLVAARRHDPFRTILADPPWRFQNRTGKMAPEHLRLARYRTMTLQEIEALPVGEVCAEKAHLYLWVPNALLPEGISVMRAWGFDYKTNIIWFKTRKDGGPDRRGVGFYFRNVTEVVLFGIRGKDNRTLAPGRRQPNLVAEQKREHSRKPEGLYEVIEACSPGPRLELFARTPREGWTQWGNELDSYEPKFSSPAYGVGSPATS